MSNDDDRKRSIERAKTTAQIVAATGLNALLPGTGSVAVRLAQHVMDVVSANRFSRLEDFHQRVFDGDIGEHEVNERFKAMEDGDFQHLLATMLTDIEKEKVALYSTLYIHLVERKALSRVEKRDLVLAATQLRSYDLVLLADLVRTKKFHEATENDSTRRLVLVGAADVDTEVRSGAMFAPEMGVSSSTTISPTKLGETLVDVLGNNIEELRRLHPKDDGWFR